MTEDLVLYTNPKSRGRIVRWMLEEVGAPYRRELVEYAALKDEPYLSINPMGKIPALEHGGTVITECAAICAYLADAFPEAGLASEPQDRGAYYRWLFFAAGPLEAAIMDRSQGHEVAPEMQRMSGYGTFARVMDVLEGALAGDGYIAGERFSAADVYLGMHVGYGLQFGTIEERPAFAAYWARVSDREAFRRARALDDADLPLEEQAS